MERQMYPEKMVPKGEERSRGLTEQEARRRLARDGYNQMQEKKPKSPLVTFMQQLQDPLIYILVVAAIISIMLQEISDAVIIVVVVLVNATVGMIQEGKAEKALEALKQLTSPQAVVVRDGIQKLIPAKELVEGDLVCLEAGAQVPADLQLIETSHMKVEEAALTGESLPVEKDVTRGGHKDDNYDKAFMSTYVTQGRGMGIVTATGMRTELGRIAALIDDAGQEATPLQKRMGELGKLLSILSIGLCVALFIIAVLQHRDIPEMLITAISLAVAVVPEGLPAVVTVTMALSVAKMVRVNTIVRRMPSVETLGAVTVVCSDKTGTLTKNCMTVEKVYLEDRELEVTEKGIKGVTDQSLLQEFLQGMVLCNDAHMQDGNQVGDPTELALLQLAWKQGMDGEALRRKDPRTGEVPFDSGRKMMTTIHRSGVSYTKGAPDEILKRCTHIQGRSGVLPLTEGRRSRLLQQVSQMSGEALRTLALAKGDGQSRGRVQEQNLIWLGMLGMLDPIRPEAAAAVQSFRRAGVSTVMITGDHVDTAFAVGKKLGIVERKDQCLTGQTMSALSLEELAARLAHTRVFARVTPSQKVDIVKGLKANGEVVAMMGDGVNDAPSLKNADIGIAMGKGGTDVAKQASDIILTDDNFATVEKAIAEGRGIYENIRKTVIFLLSSNLGEMLTMFVAVLIGLASPLKSGHILWINLITDSLPALALSMDKNDPARQMECMPRKPGESLFARGGLLCTCFYGALITLIGLVAFLLIPLVVLQHNELTFSIENIQNCLAQERILSRSQTYAFTVLGMCQLFHAVGMRDTHRPALGSHFLSNPLMVVAVVLGFALQVMVTEIPFFIDIFGTSHLSLTEWGLLTLLAAVPLLAHECIALLFMQKTICH
ncbi:MAG: cation-translocating P-type ATPase [Lachnospiraceae bacterium]|nr:cation-translocating P-type ATPase [Lachnospiraceae bacterium]